MNGTDQTATQVQTIPATNDTAAMSVGLQNANQPQPVQNNPTGLQPNAQQQQIPVSAQIGTKEGIRIPVETMEVLTASNPEIQLAPELKEAGVEVKPENLAIPASIEKLGVLQHAKESQPVKNLTGSSIKLPMNITHAQNVMKKHKSVRESILWLALLVLRQWQLAYKKNLEASHEDKEAV